MCTSQWEGGGGGGRLGVVCGHLPVWQKANLFFRSHTITFTSEFRGKRKKNIRLARYTVIPSVVLLNLVVRVSVINGSRLF